MKLQGNPANCCRHPQTKKGREDQGLRRLYELFANPLKGGDMGDYIGDYYRGIKGILGD